MTDGEAKAAYGPLDEEGSMTKEYWPDGLVDEYTPESLGPPENWLTVLLADNAVASDGEISDDEYSAVRGTSKVGETLLFDVCTHHPQIDVEITADGYKIVSGAVPDGTNWFAVSDDWEGMQDSLDALMTSERELVEVGSTVSVDMATWGQEWWQIRSATEIVQVEAPPATEEAAE